MATENTDTEVIYAQPQAVVTKELFAGRKRIGPLQQDDMHVNNTLWQLYNRYALGEDASHELVRIGATNFLRVIGAFLFFPQNDTVTLLRSSQSREQFGSRLKGVFLADSPKALQKAYPKAKPIKETMLKEICSLWEYYGFNGISRAWGIETDKLPLTHRKQR